jgi:ubiquinone/menaquinone biosynthesis C-methylase UbiE
MHHEIAERTATLAQEANRGPRRVLDVGCGTGYLLRLLGERYPERTELHGIDPAPNMIAAASAAATSSASAAASGGGTTFSVGVAEHLPYPDGVFDLVVSTTSFDHWVDQQAGLLECARVLAADGRLVLVDQFSLWLLPTLLASRRTKARTRGRANRLIRAAGFKSVTWRPTYAAIIQAVTAAR